MNATKQKRVGPLGMALLGGAVLLGWCLHDLVVFLTSGEPELVGGLLLACGQLTLLGVLAGGLLGLICGRVPGWILFVGAALALGISFRVDLGLAETRLLLGRSLATLEMAMLLGAFVVQRCSIGHLRAGLALGALACVGMGYWQIRMLVWQTDLELRSYLVLGAALGALALGRLPRFGMRSLMTCLFLAGISIPIGMQAIERNQRNQRTHADQVASVAADPGGRNLLLVILDTVRADHLQPYGYERQTTPLLDEFVGQQAERYAWARSASSWTLPSHASLLTGLLPSEHGATHPRRGKDAGTVIGAAAQAQSMREDNTTLAERLTAEGYRSGAIVANHYYLGQRYGLSRGYQHYDARPGGDVRHYLPLAHMAWVPLRAGRQSYRDAASVTNRALDWMSKDAGARPWFLTLNYMDAHSPYLPAAPHDAAFGGGPVPDPTAFRLEDRIIQYDRSLHYIDSELMRFISHVDLENTVVMITSDHGEALGDHGYWMHGWTLFDSITRVPLFVKPVGRELIPVRNEPIGGADIFGLAMFELGLAAETGFDTSRPAGEWFQPQEITKSKALADKDLERDLLIWAEGSRKWTVSSTGQVTAIDVLLDPSELSPLALSDAQVAQARERARAWWDAHPPMQREATLVDEAGIEHLKDLGYLGDAE